MEGVGRGMERYKSVKPTAKFPEMLKSTIVLMSVMHDIVQNAIGLAA